jgi:hypothetical protein
MRIIWEADDIIPMTRVYTRAHSEEYIIGYVGCGMTKTVLISMNDGSVSVARTRTEMAEDLTANGYRPTSMREAFEKFDENG